MKKHIPNLLSFSRIILSPLVIFLYFYNSIITAILALIFLIILEITDALDGMLARKFNIVSDLGKVLDPFADTVFHITMFTIRSRSAHPPENGFEPIREPDWQLRSEQR